MDRVLPQLLRLAAGLAAVLLGLLVVLDVIPRNQLATLGVKIACVA